MKAIVAGATGLTGSQIIKQLEADRHVESITALIRKIGSVQNRGKVETLETDFNEPAIDTKKLKGAHVFCALGTTIKKAGSKEKFKEVDYEYPLKLAQKAAAKGAAGFHIITAIGADPDSRVFYNRVKGEVERELKNLNLPLLAIYRPSLLLGERSEGRLGEDIGKAVAPLLGLFLQGPVKKYRAIDSEKVAKAMVKNALNLGNGIYTFESDEITEIADE